MEQKIKIAVVGPIPQDTIITHHNETITKYGCVTHPTIALAKLLENSGQVLPISHVHKVDHQGVLDLFKPYSAINTSGVSCENNKGTVIELKFIDQNNRRETQLANMSPITPDDVKPYLEVDSFVFVPITNFEIELETLKHIKKHSQAKIIFDAHGPTTYVDDKGKRLRKYWSDMEEWLPHIDVLKMNLEESHCSWHDQDYSYEDHYNEDDTSHLEEFAKHVLDKGVEFLYVTLDSRGCSIFSKDENGEIKHDFVNSVPVEYVVDTTGCGDSFAGGLAYGFSAHNDPIKAAHYANTLGARRTQGKGFDVFKSLEETEKIIDQHY